MTFDSLLLVAIATTLKCSWQKVKVINEESCYYTNPVPKINVNSLALDRLRNFIKYQNEGENI